MKSTLLFLIPCFVLLIVMNNEVKGSDRAAAAIQRVTPSLTAELNTQQLTLGDAVYIRIFKAEAELEVWLADASGTFQLFKTFPICRFSGDLGPKLKEGDHQSPEGFYFVKPNQMNPQSQFHLSFNLGFPNAYDRHHGRTGSFLMVHGSCVSVGCYAMTDPIIEEIYTLMHAAFAAGQPYIRVHAFPFRMSDENMQQHQTNRWHPFWQNLKEGHDWFETHGTPPNTEVVNGRYVFD